jgi:hypothetical protein
MYWQRGSSTVFVTGTVTCLHCGYVCGQWAGRAGAPLIAAGLRNTRPPDPTAPICCGRCQGPVFLDGATAVRSTARLQRIARLRRQIAEMDARGPGRAA